MGGKAYEFFNNREGSPSWVLVLGLTENFLWGQGFWQKKCTIFICYCAYDSKSTHPSKVHIFFLKSSFILLFTIPPIPLIMYNLNFSAPGQNSRRIRYKDLGFGWSKWIMGTRIDVFLCIVLKPRKGVSFYRHWELFCRSKSFLKILNISQNSM